MIHIDMPYSKPRVRVLTERDRQKIHIALDRQTRTDAMAAARRMRDQYQAPESAKAAVALARQANRQLVSRLRFR